MEPHLREGFLSGLSSSSLRWQLLYFFPLSHQHGSFLPGFLVPGTLSSGERESRKFLRNPIVRLSEADKILDIFFDFIIAQLPCEVLITVVCKSSDMDSLRVGEKVF